jgi:O-antigen/teichoic acid export membrane protein
VSDFRPAATSPAPGAVALALVRPPIKPASEDEASRRHLAFGSAMTLALYIGGAGLTYFVQIAIARFTGAQSYGVYVYVLAWVSLIVYATTLGFNVSLMRFVPAYLVRHESGLALGCIDYAVRRAGIASLVAVGIGVGFVLCAPWPLRSELATTFLIGFATLPVATLSLVGIALARCFGATVAALAPDRLLREALLLAFILVLAWLHLGDHDATTAMGASLLASLLAFGALVLVIGKNWPEALRGATPLGARGEWRASILPLTIIGLAEILLNRAGIIVLGLLGDVRGAGLFGFAFNLAALTVLPRLAVGTLFSPSASRLHAIGDRAGLQSLFSRGADLSVLGATLIAAPLLLFTPWILGLIGPDFVAATPIVRILVAGQVLAAAWGPQQSLMNMTGRERQSAIILIVFACINVVIAFPLAWAWHMTGAAIASAATFVGWNLTLAYFVRHRLDIRPGPFAGFGASRRGSVDESSRQP